jgi:phosphoribosylformylglycinamidine synthase
LVTDARSKRISTSLDAGRPSTALGMDGKMGFGLGQIESEVDGLPFGPSLAIGTATGAAPMKTRIYVTLKNGVLDPQGKAIHHALEGLGFGGVEGVRQGKLIELEHADDVSDADLDSMCRKLLANTVIENYRIERA